MLTRRTAIRNAVVLLGGTVTATQLGLLTDAVAAIEDRATPDFLSPEQFSMVGRIADLIIPETDTPGALSAGVPGFIDMMLAEWASSGTKSRYLEGLRDIDQRARDDGMEDFSSGTAEQQSNLLQTLDDEAFADGAEDTFFRNLKTLIVFGYYSSQEGASIELRFDRTPGSHRGCVPYEEIGRSWST